MAISVAFVCPPVCPSVAYIVHLTVLEAAMTVVDCTAPLNRYTCYGAIEVVAIIIIIIIIIFFFIPSVVKIPRVKRSKLKSENAGTAIIIIIIIIITLSTQ